MKKIIVKFDNEKKLEDEMKFLSLRYGLCNVYSEDSNAGAELDTLKEISQTLHAISQHTKAMAWHAGE